jgi:hypothetical protein
MDEKYKRKDPIEGYRNYYMTSKKERGLLKYTRRDPPDWAYAELSKTTVAQMEEAGDAKN